MTRRQQTPLHIYKRFSVIAIRGSASCNSTALCGSPSDSIPSPLFNINTETNEQRRSRANCKQEREPLPIVLRLVNDRLDDIRSDNGRSPVREIEKTKELRAQWSTSGWKEAKQHAMLSNPGGQSSAIIVCEYA